MPSVSKLRLPWMSIDVKPQKSNKSHKQVSFSPIGKRTCFFIPVSYTHLPNADDIENLHRLIDSYGWNVYDHFCVICVHFSDSNIENIHRMYATAVNILDVPCIFISNFLVFILSYDFSLYKNLFEQILQIAKGFDASVICSLPIANISNIYYAYDQTQFVVSHKTLQPQNFYSFYNFAVDYIIANSDKNALLFACKKEIIELSTGKEKNIGGTILIQLQYRALMKYRCCTDY